jgi:hypothetical protein
MTMGKEIWKDISGYNNGYQVSNLGRVRRIAGTRKNKWGSESSAKERIISEVMNIHGYKLVNLYENNNISQNEIAKIYGLDQSSISYIVSRKRWVN